MIQAQPASCWEKTNDCKATKECVQERELGSRHFQGFTLLMNKNNAPQKRAYKETMGKTGVRTFLCAHEHNSSNNSDFSL